MICIRNAILTFCCAFLLASCSTFESEPDTVLLRAKSEALAESPFGSSQSFVTELRRATNVHDQKQGIACGVVTRVNSTTFEGANSRRFIYRQNYVQDDAERSWKVVFEQNDDESSTKIVDIPLNDKSDAAYHTQTDQMIHWLFNTLWDTNCGIAA